MSESSSQEDPGSLPMLLADARACRRCADHLEPRPVLRLAPRSRILIIGQAPGAKVHASGIPWDDASGDHLREWLGVDRTTFDDPRVFGILPMAFCYPGRGKGGDFPPPPICSQTWHGPLIEALQAPMLTLLVGQHAQRHHLGARNQQTVTATVQAWRDSLPAALPLPHPAWRSRLWMRRNPWFEAEVLPFLRAKVAEAVDAVEGLTHGGDRRR